MKTMKQWRAWAKKFTAKAKANPKANPATIDFRNAAEVTQPLEILIYGEIGSSWYDDGSVAALDFAIALAAIPRDREIKVRINSPGGSVFEGWAIYNLLAERRDKVVCIVDGLAASIASVIALAGRELQMTAVSSLMIHDVSGVCMGTAEDMAEMSVTLEKLTNVIAGVYARKTGKPIADVNAAMDEETWFTGDEAKTFGFCDKLADDPDPDGEDDPTDTLSGAKSAPAPTTKPIPADAKSGGGAIRNAMNRTQVIALLNKLGVQFEASATDEALGALLNNYTPPAPAPVTPTAPVSNTAEIRAEVTRISSITAAVQKCADELRIPGDKVESYTARALADETFLAEIQTLAPRTVGADPVTGTSAPATAKNLKRAAFTALTAKAQMQFCKDGGKITE